MGFEVQRAKLALNALLHEIGETAEKFINEDYLYETNEVLAAAVHLGDAGKKVEEAVRRLVFASLAEQEGLT